jgi:hypothetical protein
MSVTLPADASIKPHDPPVHAGIARPTEQNDGPDATSVTLGVLGIALLGVGLATTLGANQEKTDE